MVDLVSRNVHVLDKVVEVFPPHDAHLMLWIFPRPSTLLTAMFPASSFLLHDGAAAAD